MRARQRTIPDDRSPNLSFLITVVLCCLLYWKLAAAKWPSEARPGLAEHNGKLDDSRIASQRFMISRHSQDFNAYKIRYRKQYSSPGEELFRFWLYLDSKLRVLVSKLTHLLQAERRYYLDLNQFSDRTTVEKSKLLGVSRKRRSINADLNAGLEAGQADGQPEPGHDEANQEQRENELESVIDWRYEGGPCLSELVPDEGGCGSCYAMAVVRLFEWLHCRQRPTTPPAKFSAQYMVDCGRPFGLLGCQSGCPLASLNFIRQAGLLADSVMPYRAEERPCLSSGEQWLEINVTDPVTGSRPVKARRHASALVPKSVQSAVVHNRDKWLDELRQQPLLVFVAFPKEFMDYGGGLFEPGQCDQSRLHNMLLVGRGYDKRHKRAYWVLANSFGPDFGESGYVRVPVESVDDGDGTSGQEAPQGRSQYDTNCILWAIKVGAEF